MIFGRLTGRDPRSLGGGECSAFELGLSTAEASELQQIAFDELTLGAVTAAPSVARNGGPQRCTSSAPP